MPLLDRPTLSAEDACRLLAECRQDAALYAGVSLMLLAGLRPGEVDRLTVADYEPGPEPCLDVDGRRIRIAPSAARALDAYLGLEDTEPGEPLLMGVQGHLQMLASHAAARADVRARVHDLRRAAMNAVLEDGAPMAHIEAYFGIGKALDREGLVPLPEGYDAAVARSLEAAFGA